MKKHRVLIIRNAYQQDTGGAEQYAFNLAKALLQAGHVPVVVTKHQLIHAKCRQAGIRSVRGIWHESQEWGKHYYLRYALMPVWYMWLIWRHRINIVHPQSRDDFVFATTAAWLTRRPVIWTDHADLKYIMDRVNRPHPRMQAWILRAAQRTRQILSVSNSEKASVLAVAPEFKDQLAVVHNGVFKPTGLQPVDKGGKFVIGTNARLVPDKGIAELIEGTAPLLAKNAATELWLLGGQSGNQAKYEDQAKNLGVVDQVKFLGYVDKPNDFVASMDIFVHASYHEAFSLAIIEAAMLSRPIIATKVGGTPEIINEKTGLLIPPQDAEAIQKAVQKLLDKPSLRVKLGDAAQALAVRKFDFQKIVEQQIMPIYDRIRQ